MTSASDHHDGGARDELLVLSRADVEAALDPAGLRRRLVEAFVALSAGTTSAPARIAAVAPDGLLAAMPGFVPEHGLVVKAVTVFPGNLGTDRASHQGLVAVFDAAHGGPLAVMDAELLTELRTAASAAIAADLLAAPDAAVLAVIGAGALGHQHLRAFAELRPWSQVRVASRRPERAEALAERHPGVVPVASFRDAVRDADVVCLCTDAEQPVLEHDWLRPVAHVSSVGRHRELADATVRAALSGNRLIVEWRGAVTNPPVAGAAELQGLPAHDVLELGELLAGTRRAGESGLSAYKSTGHAVEDAAAARAVLDTAAAHGLGRRVPI